MKLRMWLIAGFGGLCATILFLQGIGNPPVYIFDEPKYVGPARDLMAGRPDSSPDGPPLGKLILVESIRRFGDTPRGWRVASAVFGGLTVAGVFVLGKLLLGDTILALMAAALALLNNFLFVLSRTAMMDIFFFTFAVWSVAAYTAAIRTAGLGARKRRWLLAAAGVLAGLSGACKWNAVDELCVYAAIGAGALLLARRKDIPEIAEVAANVREAGIGWYVATLFALPILPYALTYWPYFRMLHVPMNWKEFAALHVYIWKFHLAVKGNPGNTQMWYEWPFRVKPMLAFSFLVGNWYVMWGGLAALAFCLKRFGRNLAETLIVLLYFANYLQWAVTPQSCLYYYYYFPAAMFLGMAIPVALSRLPERVYGVRLSVVALFPAVYVFLFCVGEMAQLPTPYDCILGCWR